jgi:tripartite-type tricarboxylate transporter receptor subunit TctC
MQRRSLLAAGAALCAPAVRAQAFPSAAAALHRAGGRRRRQRPGRPHRHRALGKALGQTIVVENIGGGGGAIACQTTAKAAPDGYTLMQGYVATHGTSPATRSKLPYDAIADFTPVGMIGATPNVLVVNASLEVQTIQQFVAYLRRNPGRASYGSAGQGSLTHLTMELFKQAGRRLHGAPALPRHRPRLHRPARWPDAGDVPGSGGRAAAHPLRPGACTGRHRHRRHPLLKDVPTMIEAGFKGFDAQQWYGVVGPAGLPAPVLKTLNDTLASVLTGARPARQAGRRGGGAAADDARAVRALHPRGHRALDPTGP